MIIILAYRIIKIEMLTITIAFYQRLCNDRFNDIFKGYRLYFSNIFLFIVVISNFIVINPPPTNRRKIDKFFFVVKFK